VETEPCNTSGAVGNNKNYTKGRRAALMRRRPDPSTDDEEELESSSTMRMLRPRPPSYRVNKSSNTPTGVVYYNHAQRFLRFEQKKADFDAVDGFYKDRFLAAKGRCSRR